MTPLLRPIHFIGEVILAPAVVSEVGEPVAKVVRVVSAPSTAVIMRNCMVKEF